MIQKTSAELAQIAGDIRKKLLAEIRQSKPIKHPGAKGSCTEQAWINLFKTYLPTRFRVASGFVIDSCEQVSDQIDVLIFDSNFSPQIIPNKVSLYIPAEAVYAAFEVKQKISKVNLKYAAKKVQSVRGLHITSAPYTGDGESRKQKKRLRVIGGLLATKLGWGKDREKDRKKNWETPALLPALQEANKIEKLDFVFVANDGLIDMMETANGVPCMVQDETGIAYGLFRLLEELTMLGTVPAISWPEYYSKLGLSTKTLDI